MKEMHPTVRKRIDVVEKTLDRFNTGINVIVTAHASQRMFMKACLESIKSIGWILVVYDNPLDNYKKELPSDKCFKLMDSFFMKHDTRIVPGPTYPQFWNFRYASDILAGSSAELIFAIGADCILEKPQGISEIVKMLGDNDLISCSTLGHAGPFCGTKSFLVKKQAFVKLVSHIQEDNFYPFKDIGNLENRFGMAIKALELKEVSDIKQPKESQFAYGYDEKGNSIERGTWGEVLGFRHLGGEHKVRRVKKKIPIEEKYYDKDFLRDQETDTIAKYWKTGDSKFIKQWWKT